MESPHDWQSTGAFDPTWVCARCGASAGLMVSKPSEGILVKKVWVNGTPVYGPYLGVDGRRMACDDVVLDRVHSS